MEIVDKLKQDKIKINKAIDSMIEHETKFIKEMASEGYVLPLKGYLYNPRYFDEPYLKSVIKIALDCGLKIVYSNNQHNDLMSGDPFSGHYEISCVVNWTLDMCGCGKSVLLIGRSMTNRAILESFMNENHMPNIQLIANNYELLDELNYDIYDSIVYAGVGDLVLPYHQLGKQPIINVTFDDVYVDGYDGDVVAHDKYGKIGKLCSLLFISLSLKEMIGDELYELS